MELSEQVFDKKERVRGSTLKLRALFRAFCDFTLILHVFGVGPPQMG